MPGVKSFRANLLEAVDEFNAARTDGAVTVDEWLSLVSSIAKTAGQLVRSIHTDEEFEALVLDTEWLVVTYVVPINITHRPFIEALVDANTPSMVRPILESVRASIRDKK